MSSAGIDCWLWLVACLEAEYEIPLCFPAVISLSSFHHCLWRQHDDGRASLAPLQSITVTPACSHGAEHFPSGSILCHGNLQHGADVGRASGDLVHREPIFDDAVLPGVTINQNGLASCSTFSGMVTIQATAPMDPCMSIDADGDDDIKCHRHGTAYLPVSPWTYQWELGNCLSCLAAARRLTSLPANTCKSRCQS